MEKLLKRTCFHGTGLGAVQSMELGWVLCRGCQEQQQQSQPILPVPACAEAQEMVCSGHP